MNSCHDQGIDLFLIKESLKSNDAINKSLEEILQVYKAGKDVTFSEDSTYLENMRKLVVLNNSLLKNGLDLLEENERFKKGKVHLQKINSDISKKNDDLKTIISDLEKENNQLSKTLLKMQNSKAFSLGKIIIAAFKKPGKNTILFPFHLVKLIKKRKDLG